MMLAIQDSQLAHSALQLRVGSISVDILFEGTEAGIASQEKFVSTLGSISGIVRRRSGPPGSSCGRRRAQTS